MKNSNLKTMITLAMLSAAAFVSTFAIKMLPIPSVMGFLDYDPKDIIIAIGGFIFGPLSSVVISLVSSLIEMFTLSHTGWIGLLMNVLSSCSFAATAALFYKRKRTFSSAVFGIVTGSLVMCAAMVLWNYFITPLYMQVSREYVATLLLPVFVPFNLLKAGINASLTILVYKPVITALRRAGFVKKGNNSPIKVSNKKNNILINVTAAAVCMAVITLFVIFIIKTGR